MSDIWGSLTKLFNLNAKKIYIDNFGFRLHYKVTTAILVLCGILVTSRQYFGDPIDCITNYKQVEPILDQYCWVHGTFTSKHGEKEKVHWGQNHKELHEFPGLIHGEAERQYANFYQWIWIVLLIQAACFYIAHFVWKTWEGGRIKDLIGSLNSHILEDAVKTKHQATIMQYFAPQAGVHRIYAYKYFICELLCLINVLVQILLTHNFIGDRFLKYGFNIFAQRYGEDLEDGKMNDVFPYVTFCVIATNDLISTKGQQAMCVLPINVLNRRIYMFLWFWFVFLTCTSAIAVIYRVVAMISPTVRKWRFRSCCKMVDDETIDVIVTYSNYGDWFFLYELGRNMNPLYFAELLKDLAASWVERPSNIHPHAPPSVGGPTTEPSKATLLPY